MIRSAIHIYRDAFQFSHDSADISEDIIPTLVANVRQSIFCAEDDVSEQVCVGVCPMREPRELGQGRAYYMSRL